MLASQFFVNTFLQRRLLRHSHLSAFWFWFSLIFFIFILCGLFLWNLITGTDVEDLMNRKYVILWFLVQWIRFLKCSNYSLFFNSSDVNISVENVIRSLSRDVDLGHDDSNICWASSSLTLYLYNLIGFNVDLQGRDLFSVGNCEFLLISHTYQYCWIAEFEVVSSLPIGVSAISLFYLDVILRILLLFFCGTYFHWLCEGQLLQTSVNVIFFFFVQVFSHDYTLFICCCKFLEATSRFLRLAIIAVPFV